MSLGKYFSWRFPVFQATSLVFTMHYHVYENSDSSWLIKAAPNCIICDLEVCKSIAIVCGNWMAATCKLLSFATVILDVSPYCLFHGCEVGRSNWPEGYHWDQTLRIFGSRKEEYGLNYLSNDNPSSLVIDWKIRGLDLWLKLWECVVLLMYCTEGQSPLLLSEMSFGNETKRQFKYEE